MKKKVILLTNIITPYTIPLLNYISQRGNFNLKVLALAEKEKNREWKLSKREIKFNYKIIPGFNFFFYGKKKEKSIHINFGVILSLIKNNPDIVIISGYDTLAYWQAFFYCKILRKKCILWNGTTLFSTGNPQGFKGFLKKFIIRRADRFIAYGTKAKEYLEYFGAKPENIFISINTVDVSYFKDKVKEFKSLPEFLQEKQQSTKMTILYVGQLIKRKGAEEVLKALNVLNDSDINFIIVGSGPEKENLKNFCTKNNLKNVIFEGFRQQDELPKYYALADVFILPSLEEVWGLVVNEALASGLYVLCSKYAGATYDLISKDNGMIFDPNNIEEIAKNIQKCKTNILLLRQKKEQISKWMVENFNIEQSGKSILLAINF
ncbi:MAG: glycosyltransferase family 4 protein [Candidatus Pacebacteria bacterium]|jgi:glycosyltransferase involved in cell wall biosynthesis|nr:glycosyltransferase family 4 protein [Candidatus Paceibacterota bacterium]